MRRGQFKTHCKYGHPKIGENLLLRERVHADGREQVERICRICLNRQKRDYDARQAQRARVDHEKYVTARLKRGALKEFKQEQ